MKDEDNTLWRQRQPGPLADALGAQVEQLYALSEAMPVSGRLGIGTVSVWAEALKVRTPEAEVLLRYGPSTGWLENQPAVVSRKVGNGRITYIGAWLDAPTLSHALRALALEAGLGPAFASMPDGVDVSVRTSYGKRVVAMINFSDSQKSMKLPTQMRDLLLNRDTRSVTLDRFGVAVLLTVDPKSSR